MNWVDAQQYCRERHTDLVSVRTSAENEEIQRMVPAGRLVWIGLFGDTWKWSDGRDSLFRYWLQGNPQSSGSGSDCVHVDGGAWRTQSCDSKSSVLCYYYKKRSVVKISSDVDMCDPAVQQQIQQQLETKMKSKGINDFKIRWRMSGKQVSHNNQIKQCAKSQAGEV
ncbi:L-selectin [Austrofundulus limnaeus]|uniref:L-selectin n=1 Tax=Austrofundulus limnaeus TaxID=52670 RepID=A0A2I4CBC5_AUSLI|nr:PREDICTED: L-selectin-like [Austrofundulus limnaeus]